MINNAFHAVVTGEKLLELATFQPEIYCSHYENDQFSPRDKVIEYLYWVALLFLAEKNYGK